MTFRFTAVTDLIHFTTSVRAASSVRLQSRIIQKHFDRRFHSGYSTLPKRCQHRLTKTREEILADFHSTFRNIKNNSIFGLSQSNIIHSRQQSNKASSNMATTFSKVMIRAGQGTQRPKVGDVVLMEYTGWLYDASKPNNRGDQFDSSVGRGDFKTQIGVGRVIKGWDQGVPQMTVGERAVLTIPGNMAYGSKGFPGLIPANATLIFEVELKAINP